jgi:ubiquinone/menaquinone biosynthesis C-methylase UbiE
VSPGPRPTTASVAFDAAAAGYDETFSSVGNPLVRLMRERALAAAARHFAFAGTLLEIGCGTGEDTVKLAARRHRVIACDPSQEMVAVTRAKVTAAGHAGRVSYMNRTASQLASEWSSVGAGRVDGVFSDFGPLNCELSLEPVRRLLEQALRPGGRFVGVVMPPVCPLEVALNLAQGHVRTALRRFEHAPTADVQGVRFPIRYYGARDFDRALGAGFRRVETRSLGVVLPPPSFGYALARAPLLLRALTALEDVVAGVPMIRGMGDHVVLVYERLGELAR